MRPRQLFLKGVGLFISVLLLKIAYVSYTGPICYSCVSSNASIVVRSHRSESTSFSRRDEASNLSVFALSKLVATQTEAEKSGHASKFSSKWWRNHTETICRLLGLSTNQTQVPIGALDKVIVDDKHKLLYCQIAKVASTNLGKIFAILVGLFNGTNPNLIPSSQIHYKYNSEQTHLNTVVPKDVFYKLTNYFKFVYVRDPFERLLSAYRNKFIKPPSSSFEYLSRRLVQIYRTNTTQHGGVRFEEFIRYLTDPKKTVPTNPHWQPFYELCRPCEVKYDFVGKLPSFNEDTRHILEVNNLTEIVNFPKMPDTSHSLHKTDLYLTKFYSTIPKDLLFQLYQVYLPDYAIFDFTVPTAIKLLMK